jgi:hypothetical protein
MTTRGLALGLWLTTLATTETAFAQSFGASPTDSVFQVTSNATTTRRGEPAIEGYVANRTGYSYRFIVLAVDGTDAAGRPLPTTTFYVNGEVSPGDRIYFKNAVPQAGANYRVTVRSFERFGGGAGM